MDGAPAVVPASEAGLPSRSACVKVVPPFCCKGPRPAESASGARRLLLVTNAEGPSEGSTLIVLMALKQLPGVLFTSVQFTSITSAQFPPMAPAEPTQYPNAPQKLAENVVLVIRTLPEET